ncbi:MAG: flagellar biosynthesis protein FlhB [Candidatus Sericytochromatia bacterium]|uniref:Flagellar biosynthetic protein FlhB n=1 Tax=Candidatus Tanganyikabacteria bacterium TaxID=2961651 RepID=A0A938BLG5_9BACT|nr:flagellar biosynthesis protein FlhB [Candidatus Tanganyikabacteria bacterium]
MADAEKTEDATPKRIADARKKGNVLRSQDVTTAVILLVALVMFRWRWEPTGESLSKLLTTRLGRFPVRDLTIESLFRVLMEDATVLLNILFPFLLALILTGIVVNYLMVGPLFTVESMRPDLTKLNPITGVKRFFSARALVELFKGVLKLIVIGAIVYQVLAERYPPILQGFRMSPAVSGPLIADAAWTLGLRCVIALIIIAVLDYYWQRYDYRKSLKMSKQEVKDESRQQEGDPLVKAEIRKRMRQAARRRMLQQVPRATVVITNPTHFAVALRYDKEEGIEVPICVAKGADDVAMRIRAIAQENKVPIIENPPLARELFRLVDLGEIIPQDLYLAVAEILVNLHRVRPEKVAP